MITTDRCSLIQVAEDDYEDLKELVEDIQVRKYLGGPVCLERFERQFIHMKQANDQWYWTVRRLSDQQFLGLISLDSYHETELMELSYQFLPLYWGNGYAKEAADAVIAFAFIDLNLDSIVSETQTANLASMRLLKYLGMMKVKTLIRFGESQTVFEIHNKNRIERQTKSHCKH